MKLYYYNIILMYDLEFYKKIKLFLKTMIVLYDTPINDIIKDDYVLTKRKKYLRLREIENIVISDKIMSEYMDQYLMYFNYDWFGKSYIKNIMNIYNHQKYLFGCI